MLHCKNCIDTCMQDACSRHASISKTDSCYSRYTDQLITVVWTTERSIPCCDNHLDQAASSIAELLSAAATDSDCHQIIELNCPCYTLWGKSQQDMFPSFSCAIHQLAAFVVTTVQDRAPSYAGNETVKLACICSLQMQQILSAQQLQVCHMSPW